MDKSSAIVISSDSESDSEVLLDNADLTFTPTKIKGFHSDNEDSGSDMTDENSERSPSMLDCPKRPSCCKRIKLEPGISSVPEFYHGDPEMPIHARPTSGYPVGDLIRILLQSDMADQKVCTVQPLGVSENAAFIVDVETVDYQDLKADDLGSWRPTGTKKSYFYFSPDGMLRVSEKCPRNMPSIYYVLTRRYYTHQSYDRYHRLIADIKDTDGCLNKYSLIQYWFDGPTVEIKPKPHGNAQSSRPYFRTAESAKVRHRQIASKHTPTSALQIATEEQGGELNIKGLNMVPRNVQQLKNYRRSDKKKDANVLYSVMLQCKVCEGKADAFVRDVKAAPEPQCVLFYDWQISDLERFVTNVQDFSIFAADTTYNLGEFYVTPTTYQHLMLEDIGTGKHPSFLGPVLVHQRKNFSAFNYFANTLISHNKKLRDICAFGTDGDQALIDAFSHNFPSAKQLRCFIHLKRNITEKLRERGIPNSIAEEYIADIFGKRVGSTYEEGLVDSNDEDDFNGRFERCKAVWMSREEPYHRADQTPFYEYFSKFYANVVRHNMLRGLRVSVGLGNPPAIFTTNSNESINAVLKQKVNFKQTEWPEFNHKLKELVNGQREECIRALSGRGKYKLCRSYDHLQTEPNKWTKMTTEQRQTHVKRFDSAGRRLVSSTATAKHQSSFTYQVPTRVNAHLSTVNIGSLSAADGEKVVEAGMVTTATTSSVRSLTVSPEECGIQTLAFETLHSMWVKAEECLNSESDIMPAPGSNKKSMMVASRSSNIPHFVSAGANGQYSCDNNCLQWKSSRICSHTLAVAEKNNDLLVFLQWYNSTNQEPNITTLGMSGLPAGRGRKGGIPRRKRSAAARRQPPEIVVNRPATRPASSEEFLLPSGSSSASSISSRSISGSLSTFSGALQSSGFKPSLFDHSGTPSAIHYYSGEALAATSPVLGPDVSSSTRCNISHSDTLPVTTDSSSGVLHSSANLSGGLFGLGCSAAPLSVGGPTSGGMSISLSPAATLSAGRPPSCHVLSPVSSSTPRSTGRSPSNGNLSSVYCTAPLSAGGLLSGSITSSVYSATPLSASRPPSVGVSGPTSSSASISDLSSGLLKPISSAASFSDFSAGFSSPVSSAGPLLAGVPPSGPGVSAAFRGGFLDGGFSNSLSDSHQSGTPTGVPTEVPGYGTHHSRSRGEGELPESVLSMNLSQLLPVIAGSLPFTVNQTISSSNVINSIGSAACRQQLLRHENSVAPANNLNPFFVRFIRGNIRVCQGCRSSLRSLNGDIPQPPFDLAIARFERRAYRDKNGELKTPVREQPAHYHLKLTCVQAASPLFVPQNLVVPEDVATSSVDSNTQRIYLINIWGDSVNFDC